MRISFKKFGKVGDGQLRLNDLTIICGPNNSGKTYISYAVYGFLRHFNELFDYGIKEELFHKLSKGQPIIIDLNDIKENLAQMLNRAAERFAKELDQFFNAPEDFFRGTKFEFGLDEQEIHYPVSINGTLTTNENSSIDFETIEGSGKLTIAYSGNMKSRLPHQILRRVVYGLISEYMFGDSIPKPFVVTSERTGVALFYKELDVNRNALLSHLATSKDIKPIELISAMQSRYAQPIQHNIDVVRDYGNISKRKSFLRKERDKFSCVFKALNDLVGGSFKDDDNQLTYSPRKERNKPKLSVPLYIASSSIKSLLLIDLYINHIAKPNEILIIDEPELNLHPDNQVKIAGLIARLVNAGVKVLVTTHSDYFIREINNLISLNSVGDDRVSLAREHRMNEEVFLTSGQVSAYCTMPTGGLKKMDVSVSGIDSTIFDDIIARENLKSQDIHLSIEE